MRASARRAMMKCMEWTGFPPLWADILVTVGLLYLDAAFLPAMLAFGLKLAWFPAKLSLAEFLPSTVKILLVSAAIAVVTGGGLLALGFWITGIVQIVIFCGFTLLGVVAIPYKLWIVVRSRRHRSR